MSEYDKAEAYEVYGEYNPTTRPEHGQDYAGFGAHPGAHPHYPAQYVGTQAQAPSGLPQSTALSMVPSAQQYAGTHDPAYYGQQYAQLPAYLPPVPRQKPEITSWSPSQGSQGTKVTVYFRSVYDFDSPPIRTCLMFGSNKLESLLSKMAPSGNMYQYELSANAPSLASTNTPDPVPLHLIFDDSPVAWESASLELGTFHYIDTPIYYAPDSPQDTSRKRKLSPQSSPRRSPTKKPSLHHLSAPSAPPTLSYHTSGLPGTTPSSPFRRPSEPYSLNRRISSQQLEYQPSYNVSLPVTQSYYGGQVSQTAQSLQPTHSPSWNYHQNAPFTTRSPSAAAMSATSRTSNLVPSPAAGQAPPLVRTSTLQESPTTPGNTGTTTPNFNPYAIYPSNAKAQLALQGDLNSMTQEWTTSEWEARRRLVQFRRSQTGSVINATFEPVTLESRAPNSICVSCIWWEEKNECYVTSVDTISLLESLVAVRFTVEEKNRIRRNLEGFRPATVSKAKPDSEEFFKLIMGFPSPKPRNIEKDVKVFPWRILATALKKIIGKYAGQPHPHGA